MAIVSVYAEIPPVVVALRRHLRRAPPDGWLGVSLEHLLAEPAEPREAWFTTYARLVTMTAGVLAVLPVGAEPADGLSDDERDAFLRLREARVLDVSAAHAWERDRDQLWPTRTALRAAGGIGSPAPRLVLVGEREPNPRGLPFHSTSGRWLLKAARAAGYDELTLALVNAVREDGEPNTLLVGLAEALAAGGGLEPPPGPAVWVALGGEADEVLSGLKIPHRSVEHPAHHRRFHHREGSRGFGDRLLAAGVPRGFYRTGVTAEPPPGFPGIVPTFPPPIRELSRGVGILKALPVA